MRRIRYCYTLYTVLKETLGTPSRKHQDWFDDQDAEIQNRLEAKHQLFRSHLNDPNSASKRDAYLKAKQDCQRDLRRMQNDWFRNKSEDIERHAASNNSKEFYRSLNAIYGRQPSAGSAPMMDAKGEHLITDKGKILERWGEHFDNVLNRPSSINAETINSLPQIGMNPSLALLPTLDQVNIAIFMYVRGQGPWLGWNTSRDLCS